MLRSRKEIVKSCNLNLFYRRYSDNRLFANIDFSINFYVVSGACWQTYFTQLHFILVIGFRIVKLFKIFCLLYYLYICVSFIFSHHKLIIDFIQWYVKFLAFLFNISVHNFSTIFEHITLDLKSIVGFPSCSKKKIYHI